jgi:hypothetical protein
MYRQQESTLIFVRQWKDVGSKLPGAIEKINTKDSYQQKPHVEINNFTSHLIKHSKKEKRKKQTTMLLFTHNVK